MAEHTDHAHHPAAAHKGAGVGGGLTKKMGPLPVWAWGLIIGVGAYFLYERMSGSSSSTTTTASDGADGSTLDPDGSTIGADPGDGSAGGTSDPGDGNTGSSGSGDNTLTGELADLGAILGLMQQIDPSFGQNSTANNGTGSGTGAGTPPMTGSTPPPTKAAVNHQRTSPVKPKTGPPLSVHGAVRAPSGSTKPAARAGYTVKGLGKGNWEYVPDKPKNTGGAAVASKAAASKAADNKAAANKAAAAKKAAPAKKAAAEKVKKR